MNLTILTEPYDDENLKFNNDTGLYELTLAYVKSQFDDNFVNDGVLQKRISKNSRKIYNFINNHSHSGNLGVVRFCLNRTEEGRKFLLEILSEQMEADLESGFNDISNQPAINFASGQVIPREQLVLNQVSVDTEQLIYANGRYFGFNLISMALLPTTVFLAVQKATNGDN